MPFFDHDGIRFHYRAEGQGVPVVWQHGLGSDVDLTFALLEPGFDRELDGFRFVGFDTRGHGRTRPLGDPDKIGIRQSADDLLALLDERKIERAVIGGISMGAAITLNFAARFPDRVLGVIASRPAWLDVPFPENLRIFPRIAGYLTEYGPEKGLAEFSRTPEYQMLIRDSADSALVVQNCFANPRAEECVVRLERIPRDAPSLDRNEWKGLRVPALVLANHQDPIHPWEFAETLVELIPGAEFREITSKSIDPARHAADLRREIGRFLRTHFNA